LEEKFPGSDVPVQSMSRGVVKGDAGGEHLSDETTKRLMLASDVLFVWSCCDEDGLTPTSVLNAYPLSEIVDVKVQGSLFIVIFKGGVHHEFKAENEQGAREWQTEIESNVERVQDEISAAILHEVAHARDNIEG